MRQVKQSKQANKSRQKIQTPKRSGKVKKKQAGNKFQMTKACKQRHAAHSNFNNLAKCGRKWVGKYTARLIRWKVETGEQVAGERQATGTGGKGVIAGQMREGANV